MRGQSQHGRRVKTEGVACSDDEKQEVGRDDREKQVPTPRLSRDEQLRPRVTRP